MSEDHVKLNDKLGRIWSRILPYLTDALAAPFYLLGWLVGFSIGTIVFCVKALFLGSVEGFYYGNPDKQSTEL